MEDSDVLNNANANNNNSSNNNEDNSAAELRELEESKRFFSRFAPPVAHGAQLHNMVQYSHLGKTKLNFLFIHKKYCQNVMVVYFYPLLTGYIFYAVKSSQNYFRLFFEYF